MVHGLIFGTTPGRATFVRSGGALRGFFGPSGIGPRRRGRLAGGAGPCAAASLRVGIGGVVWCVSRWGGAAAVYGR